MRPKLARSVHYCAETEEFTDRGYRDIYAISGPSRDPPHWTAGALAQTENALPLGAGRQAGRQQWCGAFRAVAGGRACARAAAAAGVG